MPVSAAELATQAPRISCRYFPPGPRLPSVPQKITTTTNLYCMAMGAACIESPQDRERTVTALRQNSVIKT